MFEKPSCPICANKVFRLIATVTNWHLELDVNYYTPQKSWYFGGKKMCFFQALVYYNFCVISCV